MNDKVIVITGGGTGIGRAAALQLARAGARVVIAGRRLEPLLETAGMSDRIMPVSADLLQPADLDLVVNSAIGQWGRLDLLVNNAGAFAQQSLGALDRETISSLFATNVIAPSLLTQAALPHLKETQGAIVNISSTFGHKAGPHFSHYAASKAALEHLTLSWALELAPFRIRVNAVAPGPTESEILSRSGLSAEVIDQIKRDEARQVPLQRRGTAEEVAEWIVHLASPGSSWITGQIIAVDGGLSVA
jgi:NAD(P)-dependent dehydrogenase (short-subunit alcohol dehydrogenase family)